MFFYRCRLFRLGFFTGLFDPQKLAEAIREVSKNGYRPLRREFTIERRRVAGIFPALAFGIVGRKNEQNPDAEYDYRVTVYKTRFFTRTVNTQKLSDALNQAAIGGYELFFGVKYPTRLLMIVRRESYVFIFRKPYSGQAKDYRYQIFQTPYRLFTRTINPELYEQDLNNQDKKGQLKVTFRDERRVLGVLKQPTVVGIFEIAK